MDTDTSPNETGLRGRLARVLRLKPSRTRLTKNPPSAYKQPPIPNKPSSSKGKSPLELHREKYKDSDIDTQLGERKDVTGLLHGLTHRGSFDSSDYNYQSLQQAEEERKPGDEMIASISSELWEIIADYLSPADAANLALSSRRIRHLLGTSYWDVLNLSENRSEKIKFLMGMDVDLPNQLFCFPCAKYHVRIFRGGGERLKGPGVLNPLFVCPLATSYVFLPPRLRLTPLRNLPFTFLQLALRAEKYGPEYGVTVDSLSRRWKEGDWSHGTRYAIYKNRLLLRVTSSCLVPEGIGMAPSVQRSLLLSREDYSPYFSVCQHWENSNLIKLCKCALNHIPQPLMFDGPAAKFKGSLPLAVGLGRKAGSSSSSGTMGLVSLCENCKPMRRCPKCPSEYLIELRLVPDEGVGGFKRAIVVTRWSDLGDEMSPYVGEWEACSGAVGVGNGEEEEYNSFAVMGKRAISGIFESFYTADQIPGQRILSLTFGKTPVVDENEEEEEKEIDDW